MSYSIDYLSAEGAVGAEEWDLVFCLFGSGFSFSEVSSAGLFDGIVECLISLCYGE